MLPSVGTRPTGSPRAHSGGCPRQGARGTPHSNPDRQWTTLGTSWWRLALCLLLIALTSACGDSTETESADAESVGFQTQPQKAYTWAEWVEREAPKRQGYEPYYFEGKGPPPNMSLWRPEDFLPQEYLDAEHKDVCDLPVEERRKVRDAVGRTSSSKMIADRLSLAKAGYAEAQAGLGPLCYALDMEVFMDPELGLTMADALEWARRGAASGKPVAMYHLADCMYAMSLDHSEGLIEIDDPFWPDQTLYWFWRAAEALQGDALMVIRPSLGGARYSYPSYEENQMENYKWGRLWELQAIFRHGPKRLTQDLVNQVAKTEYYAERLSPPQVQQAEAAVAEWLKTHPDVWDRIYHEPAVGIGVSLTAWEGNALACPGEPGYRENFDYPGLNRELARYGMSVGPPSE